MEDHRLVVKATQPRITIHPQQGVEADGEVLVLKGDIQKQRQAPLQKIGEQGQPNRDLVAVVSGQKPCRRILAYPLPRLFHQDLVVVGHTLLTHCLQVALVSALQVAFEDIVGDFSGHVAPLAARPEAISAMNRETTRDIMGWKTINGRRYYHFPALCQEPFEISHRLTPLF
jgi:hypothetical protein